MRKTFIAFAILALALSGCRQQKELIYFQGLEETDILNNTTQDVKDYKIRMHDILYIMPETVCIPKQEYLKMREELQTLRKTDLYRRLLQFESNIRAGKIFTRKDLGF